MMMFTRLSIVAAVVLSLSLGLGAGRVVHAVDGVIEINQASVDAAGGFPFEITQSGSYRLTSNLTVTDVNTAALLIAADDVTVDLNGFHIRGPGGDGNGNGVGGSPFTFHSNITVRNGTISDMGSDGIDFNFFLRTRVERVHASRNSDNGIRVGANSIVQGNTAGDNGIAGIVAGGGSMVQSNTARGNGSDGIVAGAGSMVQSNTAEANRSIGIFTGASSTVRSNTAQSNGQSGIIATTGSTVTHNTARGNSNDGITAGPGSTVQSNTASGNDRNGIVAGGGSTVLSNTVRGNGSFGLALQGQTSTGYAHNVVNNNTAGTVDGGTQIGTNLCNGNTTCP